MILIFSENFDFTTAVVIDWLNYYKIKWLRVNEDDKLELLDVEFSENKLMKVIVNLNDETTVDLVNDVNAYWYRRGFVNLEGLKIKEINIDNKFLRQSLISFLDDEFQTLTNFIIKYLTENKTSLNSHFSAKNDKIYYLLQAVKAGLSIPKTKISAQHSVIKEFHKKYQPIITKSINEGIVLRDKNAEYNNAIGAVNIDDINNSLENYHTFPSLFQENIKKFIELRIFFLIEECYCMAIFSQNNPNTKLDFRNYDYSLPNRFVPYKLPDMIKNKLITFMNSINLNSGSIDIILTNNNEYIFLEVNPVGQFGMISRPCNYNLERKVAEYLIGTKYKIENGK